MHLYSNFGKFTLRLKKGVEKQHKRSTLIQKGSSCGTIADKKLLPAYYNAERMLIAHMLKSVIFVIFSLKWTFRSFVSYR